MGGGRHDGPRPGLRALDQALPRSPAAAGRRRRRRRPPRAPRAAGARADTAGAPQAPDMSESDALVVFTPSGKRGRFPLGTPLLQAARTLGVDVDSVCGGRALCGRCQVLVMEGDFAKHGVTSTCDTSVAVERRRAELSRSAARSPPASACPARRRSRADLVVDVPAGQPGASPGRAQGRRRARHHARPGRAPALRRGARAGHARPVGRPAAPDSRRSTGSGSSAGSPAIWRCCRPCRPRCARANGRSPSRCTAARRSSACGRAFTSASTGSRWTWARPPSPRTCAIWSPARSSPPAALMNPQIRFGEDLMSRVSYSMMHPGGARR